MRDVTLNFINNSEITSNQRVVIFQKNAPAGLAEVIAWKVIKNCGKGWRHPFAYTFQSNISVLDCWGNYSPLTSTEAGQQFTVKLDTSGSSLSVATGTGKPGDIEVTNELEGFITVGIYKDGSLFTPKLRLPPGTRSYYEFLPTLWIGIAENVEEGAFIDPAIIQEINAEISIIGIVSADIVLTGGGTGPDAKPFTFTLENKVPY